MRDLTKAEIQSNSHYLRQMLTISFEHNYEFLPYNSAYLQKENSHNDVHLNPEDYRDRKAVHEEVI